MTKASRGASVSVEAKHTAPSSDKGLVGHQAERGKSFFICVGVLEGWRTNSDDTGNLCS